MTTRFGEAAADFYRTGEAFSKFGASDTEPRAEFAEVVVALYEGRDFKMPTTIRDWQLGCRVDKRIDDLARMFNPVIRGWITYYGRYYPSALYPTLRYLDRRLSRWAMAKYKRLRRHRKRLFFMSLQSALLKHLWSVKMFLVIVLFI